VIWRSRGNSRRRIRSGLRSLAAPRRKLERFPEDAGERDASLRGKFRPDESLRRGKLPSVAFTICSRLHRLMGGHSSYNRHRKRSRHPWGGPKPPSGPHRRDSNPAAISWGNLVVCNPDLAGPGIFVVPMLRKTVDRRNQITARRSAIRRQQIELVQLRQAGG